MSDNRETLEDRLERMAGEIDSLYASEYHALMEAAAELRRLKEPKKQHECVAIVEFRNCEPFVYRILSDLPINVDRVAKHFQETEDWDEVRDNIMLVDDLTEITL
jgi:sulfur transfer protein SufE